MTINFLNDSNDNLWNDYEIHCEPLLLRTLKAVGHDENVNVNLVLKDAEAVHQYNLNYRNIDRTTDVLSFEDDTEEDGILNLGDIIISVDSVVQQAKDYGHSTKREFCFLVVHGYLHLLGYDHGTAVEEKEMFDLQKEILNAYVPKSNS